MEVNSSETMFFPGFRLLESEKQDQVFEDIRNFIVEDILHNNNDSIFQKIRPQLLPHEKKVWRDAVLERNPQGCTAAEAKSANKNKTGESKDKILMPWEQLNETMQALALVLRGILSHDVLFAVLQKRWRVDFGAHPTREHYQMAVPFRAKDVASERTEFGHPDLTICLTNRGYENTLFLCEIIRCIVKST